MDTTYRLTQTGKQVQDLLDQVEPNRDTIAAETDRATAAEQTLQDNIDAEQAAREAADAALRSDLTAEAERAEIAEHTLQGNIDAEKQSRIADIDAEQARAEAAEQANAAAIVAEETRATAAEQTLQNNIDAEEQSRIADVDAEQARAEAAEQDNSTAIAAEETRATAAEQTLQDNIDAEEARAEAAEQQNASDISAINAKIPAEASAQNQLADKGFVNSSVATASATFRGSYNLILDLHLPIDATRQQIVGALNASIHEADNNDYCFVQIPTDPEHALLIQAVDRYKFNGSTWAFEYALNNSGFTQAQWAALNSGITSGLVAKLNGLPNNDALTQLLAGKQDNLTFDSTPTDGSQNPVTSAGIKEAIDAISGGSSAAIDAEIARATAAEQAIQDNLDDESHTRQAEDIVLQQNIEAEETRARAAEQQNATDIAAINAKIPVEASAQNQLADKNYVNTCVATDSATFRGSYNLVTDLHLTVAATRAQILAALAATIAVADNNDYAFVLIPTSDATPNTIARVERYKYNGNQWGFEYELNNSGFTQAQWDAINSGITSGLVAKLNDLPNEAALQALLQGLQNAIDEETTRATAAEQANATAIAAETTRATTAEQANANAIAAETTRATAAEETLQDNIDDEEQARIAADNTLDAKIGDNSDAIAAETTRATTAEGTLQDNIDAEETARIAADNALDAKIGDNTDAIAAETTRATAAEQANATAIAAETTRATTAEQANATAIVAETTRATTAEGTLQDNIDAEEQARIAADEDLQDAIDTKQDAMTFDSTPTAGSNNPVTSDGIRAAIDTAVGNEETRARAAEQVNALAIDDVEALIPNQATSQNQLADKAYVQNAIATNTGDFVGTFNSLAELEAVPDPHNNDYGYVISVDQQGNQSYDRYKYNGSTSAWEFEYSLNNSSFTAEEWAAIQSGITSALVTKLSDLYTKAQLDVILDSKQSALTFDNVPTQGSDNPVKSGGIYNSLADKQDVISDLDSIRSGAASGATAYQKPSAGIPKTDLSQGVQDSLDAADTAYQKPSTGIPETDLASDVQTSLGKADTALQEHQSLANYYTKGEVDAELADKQDVISDLASIRSGAAAGATAYQKPSTGIPDTDLSQGVQDSLDAAETAYQKPSTGIPETDLDAALQQKINSTVDITGKADKVDNATSGDLAALDASGNLTDSGKKVSDFATAAQGALADTAYQKPSAGIPKTDLASGVQDSLDNADSAYQLPSTGIPESDLDATTQSKIDAGATAYQKPSGGIPSTDLASGVQISLGKADAAAPQSTTYTKTEVDNLVGAEETRAEGVEQGLQDDIDAIEAKIPSAATAQNQLADKAFVNSSVATNTANYISNNGEPFTSLAQLEAYSGTLTNNDYAFVVGTDQAGNTTYTRYKYNATTQTWAEEYVLNNSSFTAAQWDAISSGITAALVGKLSDLPTNSELTTLLAGKQDVISDLASIRSGAAAGATAYQKPSTGIPDTDLSQGVQDSLDAAETAYQKPANGIPYADLAANAKGLPVGSGTVTSLSALPVTNRLIIATISANQSSVSIANGVTGLPAGCDLHVIIHATADVTITLPTSSPYVNCNADSALTVASGGYAELNFVSDGTSIYVRGIV